MQLLQELASRGLHSLKINQKILINQERNIDNQGEVGK